MNIPVKSLKPGEFYKDPLDGHVCRYLRLFDLVLGFMFPARGGVETWHAHRAPIAATRDDIILWVAQRAHRG